MHSSFMFFFLASISEKLSEYSVLMVPEETGENFRYSICWAVPLVRKQGTCFPNALLSCDAQLLMESALNY